MKIHLVDGTYELFRSFYGAPPRKAPDGREVGAALGLLSSLLLLLTKSGATHVGVAFDHVIESFRNDLYPGYKTGAGVDPALLAQFPLAERAAAALGVVQGRRSVEQIVVCSPDKDLAQLVTGQRVVCWDRRREIVYDEAAVIEKYGVPPASLPDWLALVGDAADGYPGVPGWGAKSAAVVLARYHHLEAIPGDHTQWGLGAGRAQRLAESLATHQAEVRLFRRLATLRRDVPMPETLRDLAWRGAKPQLKKLCRELGAEKFLERVPRWA